MPQEGQFGSGVSVSGAAPTGAAGGDLGSTYPNPTVVGLNSTNIASSGLIIPYALDTGSANAVAITVSNLPAAIQTGLSVRFKAAASSTGATTLTVTPTGQSAYAAINLMKRTTGGVAALGATGDLVIGGVYEATYDGTQWVLSTTSSTTYTGGTLTSGQFIRGNSNNQVQGSSGILATGGTVFTTYNSEAVVSPGIPYTRGVTSQKNETTSADASVLSVTPASVAGVYRVSTVVSVSAATAGVISWTLSWTDSNGNAQANIAMPIFQLGTAAPNTTFTTSAAGDYFGIGVIDVNNAGAAIVVKWVGGGTTTAKMSAIIERLA